MYPIPSIIMGLETEYGIFVHDDSRGGDGTGWPSLFAACSVVEATETLGFSFIDHGLEGITDMREHDEVEMLAMNPARLALGAPPDRGISQAAIRQRDGSSGYRLPNGCRYYVDMGHPEYSTPEFTNPYEAVVAQKAGDWIVEQCRKHAETHMRKTMNNNSITIHIHRNNSDGKGSSYAAHENYALTPTLFRNIIRYFPLAIYCREHRHEDLFAFRPAKGKYAEHVFTFLVTRQIITGAGKVGFESGLAVPYQISQRADFILEQMGFSTVSHRPLINTRDQPHANPKLLRRLHMIVGDSNVSELSVYLKFGITALFFMMLEQGVIQNGSPQITTPLANPVLSYHNVSRDLTLRHRLHLINHATTSALECQHHYADMAERFACDQSLGPVWQDVVQKWKSALEGLEGDRSRHPIARNLDWVIKEKGLRYFQKVMNVGPLDDASRELDLQYHDIDPEFSIYQQWHGDFGLMNIVSDQDVARAVSCPPDTTRAWLRGELIRRYPKDVLDIGWDYANLMGYGWLAMEHPKHGTRAELEDIFADNPPLDVFMNRMAEKTADNRMPGFSIGAGYSHRGLERAHI